MSISVSVCIFFLWCLASFNVNSTIEVNCTHLLASPQMLMLTLTVSRPLDIEQMIQNKWLWNTYKFVGVICHTDTINDDDTRQTIHDCIDCSTWMPNEPKGHEVKTNFKTLFTRHLPHPTFIHRSSFLPISVPVKINCILKSYIWRYNMLIVITMEPLFYDHPCILVILVVNNRWSFNKGDFHEKKSVPINRVWSKHWNCVAR